MARHVWTVLCAGSTIDRNTNVVSLFNVVEQITLPDLPEEWPVKLPINFQVVSLWARSDFEQSEQPEARLVIEAQNQAPEELEPYEINLANGFVRFRHFSNFAGFSISGLGNIWFVVQQKRGEQWEEVARVPLQITYEPLE
jgi:hypothetical protein